jgi:signal transduction histidine kinase
MASVGVLRRPDGTEYEANEWPLQRALLGGEIVWAEEAQIELRDGPKVPVLANATPILAADGALVGGILTLQDMGALQQAQSARREFLGVVSHEMRNPLSIIKGAVASVLRFDRPIGPEEVRELFQIIDERADQLRELIDHLLDINLIESSTLLVELQPLDLKVVLERAQESFSRTSTTHHLVVKTPEHVPLVLGDRNRIEQVLLNLVHNAAKFSPDLTPITIEVESGPNEVTVHVRDQGIGIPPDQLPLLFQKFIRLHAEGPGQTEGIGLGLAICKGIIEAHRGRIWAESPGLGKISTFSFTLPVASELPQTLHPE